MTQRRCLYFLASIFVGTFGILARTSNLNRDPVPVAGDTGRSIVSFQSEAQKQSFLRSEQLSPADLKPLFGSRSYEVHKSATDIAPSRAATVRPIIRYQALAIPSDTYYSNQYAPAKVSAPNGWNLTTGSAQTTIAIIDSGFALGHEDLLGQWAINPGETGSGKENNGIDDDRDGYIDNSVGWNFVNNTNNVQAGSMNPFSTSASHGTLVAGVAGAIGNNAKGMAGLCWQCKLLPITVLSDDGVGDTISVSNGIRYAVNHGANVINLSLGSPSTDPTLQDAISYALERNVVVVAAAGNSGPNAIVYPALYSGVVSVGATDSSDQVASFSSTGPALTLTAPGVNIFTSSWAVGSPTTLYTYSSGTSLSTPLISGMAALAHSYFPAYSQAQIVQTIKSGADKLAAMNGLNRTDAYGYGRANVWRTLELYRSSYSSQAAYPAGPAGITKTVFISYRNDSNITWYDDIGLASAPGGTKPVHLATDRPLNRGSGFGGSWGGDQNRPASNFTATYEADGTTLAAAQHAVQPGQIAKFQFNIIIPASLPLGTYPEYFRPLIEGGSIMNDPGTFLNVTISAAVLRQSYASQCSYPTLRAGGSSVTCFFRYLNTGNLAWYDDANLSSAPAGTKPIHLATSESINRRSLFGTLWGGDQNRPASNFSRVLAADGSTVIAGASRVEPGQIGEYSFRLQASAGSALGVYREYFQLIEEAGATLNNPGTFIDITVQ